MSGNALRMVIRFIGAVLVLAVLAIAVLAFFERPIPDVLQNVAIGSLTGLAGILSRPPEDEQP